MLPTGGRSLGGPLGHPPSKGWGGKGPWHHFESRMIYHVCTSQSFQCPFFTWVNNSNHGAVTKTEKGAHGGPREIYFYHTNRTCGTFSFL